MIIIRAKDDADMSRRAANIISAQVILHPDSVLGLATGSTPVGTYRQLIQRYREGDLDFSRVRTVNLDEYCGLPKEDPNSYHAFMWEHLFRYINIKQEHIHIPDGMAADAQAECARYEAVIAALGGIDLQLLGLGRNGHIGFNEPDSSFSKGTHRVHLTQSTIEANARFFASADAVPRFAYSMGVRSILLARRILLIVGGEDKAKAVRDACYGSITPDVPASILQLHPNVTVIADQAALSLCPAENVDSARKEIVHVP